MDLRHFMMRECYFGTSRGGTPWCLEGQCQPPLLTPVALSHTRLEYKEVAYAFYVQSREHAARLAVSTSNQSTRSDRNCLEIRDKLQRIVHTGHIPYTGAAAEAENMPLFAHEHGCLLVNSYLHRDVNSCSTPRLLQHGTACCCSPTAPANSSSIRFSTRPVVITHCASIVSCSNLYPCRVWSMCIDSKPFQILPSLRWHVEPPTRR